MLDSIKLTVSLREYGVQEIPLTKTDTSCGYDFLTAENEFINGKISFIKDGNSYTVKSLLECTGLPYDYFKTFCADKSAKLAFLLKDKEYKALAINKYNPFWTRPLFFSDKGGNTGKHIQNLLINTDNEYINILPIASSSALCDIENNGSSIELCISTHCTGLTKIDCTAAVITVGTEPYGAISKSYSNAYEKGFILTPPKSEKEYPKQLDGLGWCTWDAFYHDVTEAKIEKKLKEFKEKHIPISWIIIDDGWAQVKDFKLLSMYEDRTKFPSGLKAFIKRIKEEYGIKYVGIWHAFTGYWFGIEKDSEVYREQKDNLDVNNSGLILPSGEFDKAYDFFSTWHKYLSEQGIDFLKVDAQGNALEFYKDTPNALSKVVELHKALEKSVEENFGGAMIDCMGLSNLSMFSRSRSPVIRNSDDFYPQKKDSFESHITQNVYDAVFNDNLYYCDFDMWWTKNPTAKQSSILRAVSGGPIYTSDKVGDTDKEYLSPLHNNGVVPRCDNAAKPTADCLFGYGDILKIYNRRGDDYVAALFNLSDKKAKTILKPADLYADGKFNAHLHFADRSIVLGTDGIELELEAGDTELIYISQQPKAAL